MVGLRSRCCPQLGSRSSHLRKVCAGRPCNASAVLPTPDSREVHPKLVRQLLLRQLMVRADGFDVESFTVHSANMRYAHSFVKSKCISLACILHSMEFDDRPDYAKRLEQARRARGFTTPKKAATYFGWVYETYIQHEQGTRGISRAAGKYADAFNVSEGWLLTGEGKGPEGDENPISPPPPQEQVPLVGYVRAGSTAAFYATATDPLDWVAPIDDMTKDTVAVQIQGESLGSFFDTWIIYYDEVRSPITPDLIGKLCVVGLIDDRVVVKTIKRGKEGRFNLYSNTGNEDILDVEVLWAARVKNMAPR